MHQGWNLARRQQENKTRPEDVAILDRRRRALELRLRGRNYNQIADELKIGVGTAYRDVAAELDELRSTTTERAEAVRDMELKRLDMAIAGLESRLEEGDPQVVAAWIKVSESRRKLLGLDAPQKIEAIALTPDQVDAILATATPDEAEAIARGEPGALPAVLTRLRGKT